MIAGTRVLIAEDESLIAEELQDRLNRMGLTVAAVVASGEDAIARARELLPDLVLMDIRLKGHLDGIEAAACLREQFNIPVIYLTAHSDDATINRAKRTGPVGYLLKPFAERELSVTIELALHRHAAEVRLRESEERYATTLTSIGDAVIATDADGRVTFMNPVAEALTRYRREDAIGQPLESIFQVVDSVTRAVAASPIAKVLHDAAITTLADRSVLIARDGAEIPIADTAAPIKDVHGGVRGAVLVFRDIRERRQIEEALRKAEEHLRQVQKMEAIGRLAGGVAHDLNNLMTIVISCGDLLLNRLPPDCPNRALVKDMKGAGDRAATLARQLLAFGRRQLLVPAVINLNDIVSGLEQMIRRVIGEDIAVVSRLRPDLGRIRIDPNQMEQVIVNLAVNARDAMPEGGTLTLETRDVVLDERYAQEAPEVKPGQYVMLSVTDTGVGMDADTRSHIFEPFFTTKGTGEGTGLGLATVYGIVKQSGGYIYVDSEPGHGATFKIYLPEVADPASLRAPAEPLALVHGAETVLVVEDDEGVRELVRDILQLVGYTVLQAADGAEALRLYEQDPLRIDLLLTDAVMPHISGRVLAERLNESRPEMKVLFMSGYTHDHILRLGVQGAKVAFLQKPFCPDALTRKVREVLGREFLDSDSPGVRQNEP
jgi:PAS domain S-box-containing protein